MMTPETLLQEPRIIVIVIFFRGFTGQFDSTERLSDFAYGIMFYMRIVRV